MPTIHHPLYFPTAGTRTILEAPETFGARFDYTGYSVTEPDFSGLTVGFQLVAILYDGTAGGSDGLFEERYVWNETDSVAEASALTLVAPGAFLTPMPEETQYTGTFKRLQIVNSVPCTVVLALVTP